jgi:hypothetical protein
LLVLSGEVCPCGCNDQVLDVDAVYKVATQLV